MPHWGIFAPSVEICIDLHGFAWLSPVMRYTSDWWFDFILSRFSGGAFIESFSQAHIFRYCHDFWVELLQVHRFPHHHFSGVHVRSFIHPHGVILELLGHIGYIWRYTGTYFPHLVMEAIVLSQIHCSFHHSAEIYCICLTDCCSCDFRQDELLVERNVQVLIALLAMTLHWIVTLRLRPHDLVGRVVRLCS